MCDRAALRSETNVCFNSIHFDELNESWIDNVIENEYNDAEENQMTTSILFSHDPRQTLEKMCSICEKWCEVPSNTSVDESFLSASGDSVQEEVLWFYLNSLNIEVKQLLVLIYFLATKAVKTSSSLQDKDIGLCAAKLYFIFLKIPGSSAYSVFHPNLYRACVDCLQMPSQLPEAANSNEEQDTFSWEDFDFLLPTFISTLDSFIPLLSNFYLGSDTTTVEFTIEKLTELFACDGSNKELSFDVDFLAMCKIERRKKYTQPYIVTSLVSQALFQLARAEMNGEKEMNCVHILAGLNPHILCTQQKKSGNITQKVLTYKNNAVAFIQYNLKLDQELFSSPLGTSLKRLCMSVGDRTEIRTVVSNAIFSIMFDLKNCDLVDFIEWLLLLIDSSETSHRAFAAEILGLFLRDDIPIIDKDGLPPEANIYLTPIPAIYAILTRCDDVAAIVRTRALCVMSQHTKKMLNSLSEFVDSPNTTEAETFDEEIDADLNGEHRLFWYNFKSFREILDEIAAILDRRADDPTVAARKAALQALENLIVYDPIYLTADYLKLFDSNARDSNITTRKQVVQSLTSVLDVYPSNSEAQDCWLKCVMPMVYDPENTVQTKALSVMEDRFLNHIFSNNNTLKDSTLSLLMKLSSGVYLSHQRYLHKCFSIWKNDDKKLEFDVGDLELSLGLGRDEAIWFYIAVYSAFLKLPPKLTQRAVNEFLKPENWKHNYFMEYILKLIGNCCANLSTSNLDKIKDTLTSKIRSFSLSVELLPLMLEVLKKIQKHLDSDNDLSGFSHEIYQLSVNYLSKAIQGRRDQDITDELLAKCLAVIAEICHSFPKLITKKLTDILKQYHSVRRTKKQVSSVLRAHAFACVGKLALQDEALAKEILPEVAHELINSKVDAIRNNTAIILVEMCKRYTSLTDKYISVICRVFKDKVYLIRYQTITMLVSLLQEGYIKYKGTLFFCLLSTVIDKKEPIQELAKYCLCVLLLEKKKSIFSDHFVDSIFVFNSYKPPDNDNLSQLVEELTIFALKGRGKQKDRIQLYRFMLSYIEPVQFILVVLQIVTNIINSVAENVFTLNSDTENMLRDCFVILSSNFVPLIDVENVESEEERERKSQDEKQARKLIVVDPVVPAIISLKNCLAAEKSVMYKETIEFLADFLSDYEDEMEPLFVADRTLYNQVKLRMRSVKNKLESEMAVKKRKDPPKDLSTSQRVDSDQRAADITNMLLQLDDGEDRNRSIRFIHPESERAQNRNVGVNSRPSTSSARRSLHLPSGQNLTSTPRVLLTPMKLPDTHDVSSLVFQLDSDSD